MHTSILFQTVKLLTLKPFEMHMSILFQTVKFSVILENVFDP